MVFKNNSNLNLARTAGMLSGASRVAMMLLTTLLLSLITQTARADEPTPITNHDGNLELSEGNYIVQGDVTIKGNIICTGDVTLTVNGELTLDSDDNDTDFDGNIAPGNHTLTLNLSGTINARNVGVNTLNMEGGSISADDIGATALNMTGGAISANSFSASGAISGGTITVNNTFTAGHRNKLTISGGTIDCGNLYIRDLTIDARTLGDRITANTYQIEGDSNLSIENGYVSDGTNVYGDGASLKDYLQNNNGNTTLTAVEIYTVTFDANGGTGNAMSAQTFTVNETKALSACTYTRTGYTFAGWATTQGGNVAYTDGQIVSNLASAGGTQTLYAKWTANTYTVTFNQQDGSGGTTSVDVTYDAAMPSATMPTRDGYVFGGYFTGTDGEGTQYYNADGSSTRTWNRTENTTLYAKWTEDASPVSTYIVNLDQEGGDGGTTSVDATYDAAMPSATMPTRDGYTFGGYFTEPSGHGTQYYNADGSSAHTWDIAQNTTLHAYWKKLLTNGEISVVIPAKTYSGTVLEPVVTVKDGEGDVSDEHYTVTLPEGRTNAGNYTITITANEESALYVGSVTKTFTINKAPLTVTANDHCIFYGNAAANDGVSYSGFVNGEDENLENVLSGELTYTYTNDNGSYGENNDAPGEYAITPGGDLTAANYNITFVPGTLTVEAVIVNIRVVDTADTDGEALSGATVQVLDAEEVVKVWTSGPIEDLRAGKTYTLHETIVPDGYLPSTDYTFTIAADGTITSNGSTIFDESGNTVLLVQNSMTHVEVSVVDIVSGDKLSGGYVVVRDPENQNHIVHEWQPTTANHVIEGLRAGKTYTLQEPTAPVGYVLPTNTTFTIATDGTVTYSGTKTTEGVLLVQNSKTHVEVKVVDTADTDGEALSGAHVQVLDANENVVEVWTSTTDNHVIEGLEIDKTYTIHETVAPDGYILPTDYTFTIAANGTITSNEQTITVLLVENSKTHVKVSVVEMGSGQKLEDATVQVLDSEENVVAEWTSTTESHEIEGLKTGVEYILRETVAPEGYIISGDFTFTIAEDGTITTTGTKTEDGVLLVQNSMTQVKISVVDIADGEELEGAHVQVLDKDGKVVEEWTSTKVSHVIEGLKTGEEYTLKETVAPEGYALSTETTFTIDEEGKITYTGTKTEVLLVENIKIGDLKVSNTVYADNNEDEFTFTVTLDDETINGTYVDMTFTDGEATVTLKGGESATATGLPTSLNYTVSQTGIEGYRLDGESSYSGAISTTTSEVTFTYIQLVNVKVTKVWNDADNQDGYRPDDVTVNLAKNGDIIETVILSEENSWTYTWTNLDKYNGEGAIDYTVTEEAVDEYTTNITKADDGTFTYTIKNTHTPEETEVKVTKVWDDADNQDGYRPDDVVINLLADGKIIDTVTLSEENEWNYSWTNLDKYNGEGAIDYTVTENAVAEYTTNITKADDGTFTYTVTNSHETEETEATVELHWNDNNNQDGIRPESVTVTLSNGTEVTLNVNNNWTATVEDLPKYASGQEIAYTWTPDETNLSEGYLLTDSSKDGTTTTLTYSHTPGETSVTANVVWSDGNNTEGFRPESVTINLKKGEMVMESVQLNVSNNWSYTWTGLPTHEGGEAITYTVTEDAVDNYSTTIEGFTITNSRTVEMTTATLNIIWLDDTNKYGVRPASLNAKLSDGTNETPYTINENLLNGTYFSFTVNNLQKYINGTEIVYSLTITDEIDCYEQTGLDKNGNTTSYTMHLMTMGNCGQTGSEAALTWEYYTAEKTLYIIGSGQMMYYNSVQNGESYSNGAPWKAFANEIEHVVISDGITYVGSNTFAHCPSISSVTLPTDQQLYQIGPGAFADCTSLTNIDIPMSINNIGDGAFAGCSNLATVSIGYSDPGTFTLGSDVFPVTATLLVPESAYENYIKEKAINGDNEIDNPFYVYKNKIAPATRTFFANGTSTWMTWCDVNNWTLPEGCTAYTVGGIDGSTVTLSEITATVANAPVVIPAYTPVLIQFGENVTAPVTANFSAAGTAPESGYDSATGIVTTGTGYSFYGATTALTPAIPENYYTVGQTYILRGDKFIKADNNEGIAANKCWLVIDGAGGARQLSIVINDETTAVESEKVIVNSEEFAAATVWYDLQGRKLDGKPTKKGLYIYKGKKTVIK